MKAAIVVRSIITGSLFFMMGCSKSEPIVSPKATSQVAPDVEKQKKINVQSFAAGQWKGPEEMYRVTCAQCHDTGVGPVLLGRNFPAPATKIIVRQGVFTMPAFKESEFSEKDLDALANWISQAAAPVKNGGAK